MSDIVTGIRQAIQDLVAPELKSLAFKVDAVQKHVDLKIDSLREHIDLKTDALQKHNDLRADGLQKQIDQRADALQKQIEAAQKQSELGQELIMKSLEAFRAEIRSEMAMMRLRNEFEIQRAVAPVSERLAVVESRPA